MDFNEKIYVAGHNGMVGSAIIRRLEKLKYSNIIVKSKSELDLISQNETYDFLCSEKPDYVIAHLLTSLPVFLTLITKNKTKIILRISCLPKLNFIRYIFWKLFSKKIYKIRCPTITTYEYLKKINIFDNNKLFILRDPVIQLREFSKKKKEKTEGLKIEKNNLIIGIGRFTRQKNFLLRFLLKQIHQYLYTQLIFQI